MTLITAVVTGCSGNTALVSERLDPLTSVTVRYSEHPLVFYRNVSGRGAFTKDYVYVAPIEINRSGKHRYYIWFGIWTVDDDAATAEARGSFEKPVLFDDDRRVQLEISGWSESVIGVSEPVYAKPAALTATAYYEVTLQQLQILAQASELRLQTGIGDRGAFEPWDDQRPGKAALLEFVRGPTY